MRRLYTRLRSPERQPLADNDGQCHGGFVVIAGKRVQCATHEPSLVSNPFIFAAGQHPSARDNDRVFKSVKYLAPSLRRRVNERPKHLSRWHPGDRDAGAGNGEEFSGRNPGAVPVLVPSPLQRRLQRLIVLCEPKNIREVDQWQLFVNFVKQSHPSTLTWPENHENHRWCSVSGRKALLPAASQLLRRAGVHKLGLQMTELAVSSLRRPFLNPCKTAARCRQSFSKISRKTRGSHCKHVSTANDTLHVMAFSCRESPPSTFAPRCAMQEIEPWRCCPGYAAGPM
jgi:hypothetical protein